MPQKSNDQMSIITNISKVRRKEQATTPIPLKGLFPSRLDYGISIRPPSPNAHDASAPNDPHTPHRWALHPHLCRSCRFSRKNMFSVFRLALPCPPSVISHREYETIFIVSYSPSLIRGEASLLSPRVLKRGFFLQPASIHTFEIVRQKFSMMSARWY